MKNEHSFSIQLNHKDHVKNVSLGEETEVLFEGYLGELKSLGLIEEAVVEIKGSNGVLRIDLTRDQIMQMIKMEGDNL
ncbi:hypothetical protein KQH65_04770 [archaeon]|nr:hypothetical protein [archaeon]